MTKVTNPFMLCTKNALLSRRIKLAVFICVFGIPYIRVYSKDNNTQYMKNIGV